MSEKTTGLILAMILSIGCFAQPANIFFHRGIEVRTKVTAITEVQLFTDNGVFTFDQILRINFWEEAPDSAAVMTLRTNGIAVYLKRQRLAPIVKKVIESDYHSVGSVGIGLGLDYGGIGARVTMLPAGPVSFFVGMGSNLADIGVNFGSELKFSPHRRSSGFVTAMYGYNGVVNSTIFYGFSAGLGVKVRAARSDKNYFSTSVLYPFRDPAFKIAAGDAFAPPLLITIGFHIGF